MMFTNAEEVGLPDLARLWAAAEGGERDGHHDPPDLFGAIDLGGGPHSALPLPIVGQLLAINLQIAPLAGGCNLELPINLLVRFEGRANESLAHVAIPETIAFPISIKLLVHVQFRISALKSEDDLAPGPQDQNGG